VKFECFSGCLPYREYAGASTLPTRVMNFGIMYEGPGEQLSY